MEEFWKTDVGKILSYGIHEHNGGIGLIFNNFLFMKKQIEKGDIKLEGDQQQIDWFLNCIESTLTAKDRCKDAVDHIYKNIKSNYTEAENRLKEYVDESNRTDN